MNSVKWRKVDLHIHSNASHDCRMSPEAIVAKLKSENINLFSITDHNNVDNIDEFRRIVDIKKAEGTEIEFLPGIEVRTDRGKNNVAVHLIVIFPEGFTKEKIMDKFLSCDGIQLTRTHLIEKGRERLPNETNEIKLYDEGCKHAYVKFDKVIELSILLGALTIAAHPKSSAGIEMELDYMERTSTTFSELLINSVMNINIMELQKNFEKAKQGNSFYLNERNNFIKAMPSVMSSDSHTLESIGKYFTFIKMDTLDFEGFKQIVYEPKLRVFINESNPPIPSYPYISSIKTDGGYYDANELHMSHKLNTIIGGRGSGKSTIIDLLRFVFNKYDLKSNDYQDFLDRIYNLLRFNNSVEVRITHGSEQTLIKRTCNITSAKERNGQTTYIDNSEIPDYKGIDIELYSQGNLKQITKRANEQLKLIDDIGNLHNLHRKISSFREKLIANASLQINKLQSIEEDLQLVSDRERILENIKEKEALLIDDTVQKFNKIQEDKKYYDLVVKNLKKIEQTNKQHVDNITQYLNINFPQGQSLIVDKLEQKFKDFTEILLNMESKITDFVQHSASSLEDIVIMDSRWIDLYNNGNEDYLKYLKENNLENIADETNQLKKQKDLLLNIENNIVPRLKNRLEEIAKLQLQRDCLLNNYEKFIGRLKQKRRETSEGITESSEDIRISISEKQDKKVFIKHIEQLAAGLNIKLKDVAVVIANSTNNISEFKKCIKNLDMMLLEKEYGLTTDASGKLLSKYGSEVSLSNHGLAVISEALFELDLINFEDIVEIEILDSNDKKFKRFSRFSPGQQCAYLLSILLSANSNPLIIDQPEDELDWNYIESFIQRLRKCKTDKDGNGRQFVFVTHNQNITVLADSENIMKAINIPISDEDSFPSGRIEAKGGLERKVVKKAVLSLEGGSDAFRMRIFKYGLQNIDA